jgi:hypothetical protein
VTGVAAGAPALWRGAQVRVVIVAQVIASALVLLAAYKSARTGSFDEQTDWVVLGVAGLTGAALVSTIWLRYVQRRLVMRRARLVRTTDNTFARIGSTTDADDLAPVASRSMSHYHRSGCPLVRGKDVAPASVIEHHRAQRTPCAVCRP